MKKIFLLLFCAINLFANVGVVVDVVGDATLFRGNEKLKVVIKQELKEKDIIKTGKNAKVKIFFKDQTAVSLGKNTTFSIESYLFDNSSKSNIKFKVLRGFFKTVTGKISKIAPNRFKLQTKNATIGIRGTVFAAKVGNETDVVICTDGSIVLFTQNGDITLSSGNKASANRTSKPKVSKYTQAEKEQIIKNAGWHGSMSLEELKEYIKTHFKEPLRSELLATIDNIYKKDSSERKRKVISKNADDISFVDDIMINGREFDELPKDIEFYPEDLKDGKVVVTGLLESEDKNTPLESLHVEITTNGGESWSRAKGNGEWEWSFEPELEKEYEFSLRVVKDEVVKSDEQDTIATSSDTDEDDVTVGLSDTIKIAGFELTLNADVSLINGKISGSGEIKIPYLSAISNLSNKINVTFNDLKVENNIVTLGDIEYNNPFVIETPLANIEVDKILFSATPSKNKIVGRIKFKDELSSSFDDIELPSSSKFLPTSFALNVPFEAKSINIWREQGVLLYIPNGSFKLSYNLGDTLPKADLDIPTAQFKLGELLKYANGMSAEVGLGDFGKMPTVSLPNDVYLLDTGIKIPSGLNLTFDLNDLQNPKLTFSSEVNLENFTNEFAKHIANPNLSVSVSKSGFEATLSGNGEIEPITLLDRGSEEKSVKLVFEGDSPSFHFSFTNGNVKANMSLGGVTPKIYFGDLFTNLQGEALNKVADLGSFETPSLNIEEPLYLLGSKIKLPNGFSANVDLSDIKNPILSFSLGVDFSSYEDNIIAKHISKATLTGTISKNGFEASVTAPTPTPIDIYEPNGVKLVFNGDISFGININGTQNLPEFSISQIDANLDFGTLLSKANGDASSVIATIENLTQDAKEQLSLTLPAKVKLLNSNLAFEGIIANLNLKTKKIDIESMVDLSAYENNPILNALNGAKFNMSISPDDFAGSIEVDDELEPIDIWAQKGVVLNITGKPKVGIVIQNSQISFDFGKLDASIDFGELLLDEAKKSIKAKFAQISNEIGSYSIKLQNEVYLLGSKFALKQPQIDFNPNLNSIGIGSSVNLSNYEQPIIKAFDGATFNATINSEGFSGSLTKDGGFEPIVVLDRGGEGKDVTIEFTSSPTVSIKIKNSGVDFGFSEGSAKLHFGDLLENATASLEGLEDGIYSWSLDGKHKLYSEANAYIEDIKNAMLDLKDFKNPKITFTSSVDLSGYGGILANVKKANLKNVTISKKGFKGSLSAELGKIDIWSEKRVSLEFLSNPTINLNLSTSGFNIGFSKLKAKLNFGDLLNNATASIENLQQNIDELESQANNFSSFAQNSAEHMASEAYSWSLNQSRVALMNSKIYLSSLGGSIDLSDFSNPKITLNAMADLSRYGNVFQYVRSAELQNVTISKSGFSGSFITSINDIKIWREKGVKIVFDKNPSFYLKINSDGLKVGAKNISASVHLGSLLNDSIAKLKSLENDIYDWEIKGKNKLADTMLYLSDLKGKIDFGDLKNPILDLENAHIEGLGDKFSSITLKNAKISKDGFDAYMFANMSDIELYKEGNRKLDLKFKDNKTPTLHVALNLDGLKVGLSDFGADLVFTNMLNNQTISLMPIVQNGINIEGAYSWDLEGNYNFINDSNGEISISGIGGAIDLNDWKNPIVTFHTKADFTNYNLIDGVNLGVVNVLRAVIKKDKIEWNVALENASANYTILDLGDAPNDDVRVELKNINATASNNGGSLNSGDGTLFFGKLFEGNKQAELSLSSNNGLRTYTFSLQEDLVYKKDDNNFVTFKNPSGSLVEVRDGVYKVIINSKAIAKSSVLEAIHIGELNTSELEISQNGFKGNIGATFNGISKSILGGKASVVLRGVSFQIDSSKSMPIKLTGFDGDLDLAYFFDETTAKATLSLVDDISSLNWSFPVDKVLHVKQNFEFKGLSGSLDLSSLENLSIGLSGKFNYKGLNQDITLQNFVLNTSGIHGSINWNGNKSVFDKFYLINLGITFAGVNTEGNIKLSYKDNSFLNTGKPIDLKLSASVGRRGISKFKVDGDLQSISIANFAKFDFTSLSASPTLSNFWISLDGMVKPDNTLFASNVGVEFSGLKISRSGISLSGAGVSSEISGASADLGAMSLSITSLGLGYDGGKQLFYIEAGGSIALDIIGDASAGVKLYSNKTINVNDIAVNIKQSGLIASGSIKWFDNDAVYGNGFKATLGMRIAELFSANGLFRIGQKEDIFYWMAKASVGGGSGIPLSPIPISLYSVGGGIAYHMKFDDSKNDFIPNANVTTLILNTTMGTSGDSGYLWNGDIEIKAGINNGVLGQLRLDGTSWVLANLGEHPSDRYIQAHMVISPSMFHVWFNAHIAYEGIKVNGKLDAVLSSSEKHLFIGSDEAYAYAFSGYKELGHATVELFGISGSGFFMVDTRAIAFGESVYVYKHWVKEWDYFPDPSLTFELYAGAKALFIYRPKFQMNIDFKTNIELEGCLGSACVSAGAGVLVKFATPNPDYIWGKAYITILEKDLTFSGYIRGSGPLQDESSKPDILIFDKLDITYKNDGVSLMPEIKVISKFTKSQDMISIRVENPKLVEIATNKTINLKASTLEGDLKGMVYSPTHVLKNDTMYKFSGKMVASYKDEKNNLQRVKKSFEKSFKTRKDDLIDFAELIDSITPSNGDKNVVFKEMKVKYNKDMVIKLGGINSKYVKDYVLELYDSNKNPIRGTYTKPNPELVAKFKPNEEIRVYYYCKNESGEIRETFMLNQELLNPFNGFTVDNGKSPQDFAKAGISAIQGAYGDDIAVTSNNQMAVNESDIKKILLIKQSNGSLKAGNFSSPSVAIDRISSAIPNNFSLEEVVFKDPNKPLGKLIKTTYNDGKSYSYYRADEYKILMRHKPTNKVTYRANFTLKSAPVKGDGKRKVLQLQDNLDPTFTVSFDEERIGGDSVVLVDKNSLLGSSNKGFINEVRVDIDDGLTSIEVGDEIKTTIISTWEIEQEDGTIKTVVKRSSGMSKMPIKFIFEGIVRGYSAKVQYLDTNNNDAIILEKDMRLISGEPFNAREEEEAKLSAQLSAKELKEKVKNSSSKVVVKVGESGGFGNEFDGGFSNVGGGFNPTGENGIFNSGIGGSGIKGGAGIKNVGENIVIEIGR